MKATSLRAIARRFTELRQAAYSARDQRRNLRRGRNLLEQTARPGSASPAEVPPAPRPRIFRRGRCRSANRLCHPPGSRAEAGNARDRRKSFPAKAEARDLLDRVAGESRRSRDAQAPGAFHPGSSRSVVRDLHQFQTPGRQADRNVICAGVQSVFNQFLKRACGPFDDLAAAIRLMSSGGSLFIDMLTIPSPFEGAGEALIFRGNSGRIQWKELNWELSSGRLSAAFRGLSKRRGL